MSLTTLSRKLFPVLRLIKHKSAFDKVFRKQYFCSQSAFASKPIFGSYNDILKYRSHIRFFYVRLWKELHQYTWKICFCFALGNKVISYSSRTHNCGELTHEDVGANVKICGWLQNERLSMFLILRDSFGITQISLENIEVNFPARYCL